MNLSKILFITGMSGLYKIIVQSKSGIIVESLIDKKRMPAHSNRKINILENISIYTNNSENVPLKEVLKKIYEKENGGAVPDMKTNDEELKKYFESVLPDYDKTLVHVSDIRKTIQWYNLLLKTDIFTQKEKESNDSTLPTEEDKIIKSETPKATYMENQGKHLNTKSNVPKKTMGVRKTGTA
ncbi:MAG: DUF5606 domain-containing protein [Bacteroidota bacterium]